MSTIEHLAQLYGRSERTIKRWKSQGYPLEDRAKMREIISELRARRGVSKTSKKPSIELPKRAS